MDEIFEKKRNITPECLSSSSGTVVLRPPAPKDSEAEGEHTQLLNEEDEIDDLIHSSEPSTPAGSTTGSDKSDKRKRVRVSPGAKVLAELTAQLSTFSTSCAAREAEKKQFRNEILHIWKEESSSAANMRKRYLELQEEKLELERKRMQLKEEKLALKRRKLS